MPLEGLERELGRVCYVLLTHTRVCEVGDRASGEASFDPGEEEVEATDASVDVDELADDIAARNL